jgi:hypothetical protein
MKEIYTLLLIVAIIGIAGCAQKTEVQQDIPAESLN